MIQTMYGRCIHSDLLKALGEHSFSSVFHLFACNTENVITELNSGKAKLPCVTPFVQSKYIVNPKVSSYKTTGVDGAETVHSFDFTSTMPVNLFVQFTILANNISDIEEMEKLLLEQYSPSHDFSVSDFMTPAQVFTFTMNPDGKKEIERSGADDKLTLFFGKTNPELSNFYVSPFEINGTVYNSSEHYFMYQKAKLFDPDGDAIKKMSNDLTPNQVKKLGRQVKNFDSDVWAEKGRVHMFHALTAKFTQNPELGALLLSTGHNLIGEASPFDRIWGVGLGVSKPGVYDPAQWKGTNWMGALLMAVRGSLRQNIDRVGDYCWFGGDKLYYQSEAGILMICIRSFSSRRWACSSRFLELLAPWRT